MQHSGPIVSITLFSGLIESTLAITKGMTVIIFCFHRVIKEKPNHKPKMKCVKIKMMWFFLSSHDKKI